MSQASLKALHEMHAHFSWLRTQRDATRPGRPIVPLEHGLNADERELLASTVRDGMARGLHSYVEWLPYVVYAAEFGYRYTGRWFRMFGVVWTALLVVLLATNTVGLGGLALLWVLVASIVLLVDTTPRGVAAVPPSG